MSGRRNRCLWLLTLVLAALALAVGSAEAQQQSQQPARRPAAKTQANPQPQAEQPPPLQPQPQAAAGGEPQSAQGGEQPETKPKRRRVRATPQPSPTPATAATPEPQGPPVPALSTVRSWGYQLKNVRIDEIARSPYDLVVIDVSRGGKLLKPFTRAEVERMQRKPDGGRRIVVAYLSIGEAETYRYYWNKDWEKPETRAPWLGDANENWRDNHIVRFWHPEWKRILFESEGSYLDQILSAGFDGIYLDRVDVAFHWVHFPDEKVDARAEMVAFVEQISQRAKSRAADVWKRQAPFYVIAQNAEEFLDEPRYLAAIDGVAKEDLLFGIEGDEEPNPPREINYTSGQLARAREAGKTVLVVEYLRSPDAVAEAESLISQQGFVPFFGPRSLEWLAMKPRRSARAPLEAERRIALVIANSDYVAAPRLASPPGDGRALAEAFRRLGFSEVVEVANLDLPQLKSEIKSFGERARLADWAVVAFLGYGFDYDGANYLAPIDAKLTDEDDVEEQALPLEAVLDRVKLARKLGLVILDASRELGPGPLPASPSSASLPTPGAPMAGARNGEAQGHAQAQPGAAAAAEPPPQRLETGKGLAPVEPPRRVLVAASARHGATTDDASQPTSAFVSTLIDHLETPGLEIGPLFRAVRHKVIARTKEAQEPITYNALPIEYFYFQQPRPAAQPEPAPEAAESEPPRAEAEARPRRRR